MSTPTPLAGLVTREMRAFVRSAGRRRTFPAEVHVGDLATDRVTIVDQPWYDAALRADLIGRAVEGLAVSPTARLTAPHVWLTKGGLLGVDLPDQRWLAAARTGLQRHGLELEHFFLITRYGWTDLVTGARHAWTRVRQSSLQE